MDLIVIAGAPGTGKTTICKRLKGLLGGPMIDFGHLRGFHLDATWSNASEAEEEMTFETVVANFQRAIEWNAEIRARARVRNEFLVDNSAGDPEAAIRTILSLLDG